MITYVNTVLVGNGTGTVVAAAPTTSDAGKYVVIDNIGNYIDADNASDATAAEKIKVGIVTNKKTVKVDPSTKMTSNVPVIKWSNWIKKADIKSYNSLSYVADTEDSVVITFPTTLPTAASGNKEDLRYVVRLTFKDLPTRFRKWTESYEVSAVTTGAQLATEMANKINKEYKRARVSAVASGATVTLTAMPYDDDESVDTINVYNKVRFSANMWYTDPTAAGFASKNKYSVDGGSIVKTPGKTYAASAKLVRDMEAQSMGYDGILNRGECTWPIIKPDMNVDLSKNYDALTLEFENMYRTADDLQRKTKQTLQIFEVHGSISSIKSILDNFVMGEHTAIELGTSDDEIDA